MAALWATPTRLRLAAILLGLVLWELWSRLLADPLFISPPSLVLVGLWQILGDPAVLKAFGATLAELALAFLGSLAIGLPAGLAIGARPLGYRSMFPIVLFAFAIPQTTLLPLYGMALGNGMAAKVALGMTHGMFPVTISVVGGIRGLNPRFLESARAMGASRLQMLRRVIVPQMIPSLLTGMRLGVSANLLGVLLAELYVTAGGVGYFSAMYTQNFDPPKLFALMFVLAGMAIVLNEAVRQAERRARSRRGARLRPRRAARASG